MKIRCPSCDAEINIDADQKVLSCPYCGTPIIIEKTGVLTLERIKPDLSREAAFAIFSEYYPKGSINDLKLVYIPYYRLEKGNDVKFVPGKKALPPAFKFYKPLGDRLTLEEEFPHPEISLSKALEIAGAHEIDSAAIVYSPFYTTENRDIYIDAVTGKVLIKPIQKETKSDRMKIIGTFVIAGLLGVFLPGIILKVTIPIVISLIPLVRKWNG